MEDSTKTKWAVTGLIALGAVLAITIALKTKSYLEAPVAPAVVKNPDAARTLQIDASDLKLVSHGKQVYAKQCAVMIASGSLFAAANRLAVANFISIS